MQCVLTTSNLHLTADKIWATRRQHLTGKKELFLFQICILPVFDSRRADVLVKTHWNAFSRVFSPTSPLQHISVNQKGSSFPHWFDFSLQLMVILRDCNICSNDLYDNCDNSDVRDDWCGKDNWPTACPTFLLIFWLGSASCWCKGPPSARRDVFIKKNHAHKSLRYAMRGQLNINYIQFCIE